MHEAYLNIKKYLGQIIGRDNATSLHWCKKLLKAKWTVIKYIYQWQIPTLNEVFSYLFHDLKIISIIYFSLYKLHNGFFPLHSVILTFITDDRLFWSPTIDTKKRFGIRIFQNTRQNFPEHPAFSTHFKRREQMSKLFPDEAVIESEPPVKDIANVVQRRYMLQ